LVYEEPKNKPKVLNLTTQRKMMIILMKNWFGLDLILFYPQISIARKNLCLRQFFLILVFYLLSLKFLC